MFQFRYQLTAENYKDLNCYAALHDSKIQRKSLTLSISLACIISIVILMIFKISSLSIILMVSAFVSCIVFFPKLYWSTVFARIDQQIDKVQNQMQFSTIGVTFNDEISITSDEKVIVITPAQIKNIDFSKINCLIFYSCNEKMNTLILPNEVIGGQMKDFCKYLSKTFAYGK